jgi:hypothetical protein
VASCPNLTRLELHNALRYDATLEGLVQLRQLKHLTVVSGGGEPPVDVLKQLTGLHSLCTGVPYRPLPVEASLWQDRGSPADNLYCTLVVWGGVLQVDTSAQNGSPHTR